jgi:hypothetical protein
MKTVVNENETIIYPMLAENDAETEEDFCIVVGNSCTMINSRIVDEDDIPQIIEGLEKAIEILGEA